MFCLRGLFNLFNYNRKKIKLKILENIDYTGYAWVICSEFNYKNPQKSLFNIAYPSAIAYYYVTVVPSGVILIPLIPL